MIFMAVYKQVVVVCVQEKAAAVSGEGGVQPLEQKINNMPEVSLTVVSWCQLASACISWHQPVSAGVSRVGDIL